jgi:hypothetical protein
MTLKGTYHHVNRRQNGYSIPRGVRDRRSADMWDSPAKIPSEMEVRNVYGPTVKLIPKLTRNGIVCPAGIPLQVFLDLGANRRPKGRFC